MHMSPYTLAPFNWAQFGEKILLTNDAGRHVFITNEEFQDFATQRMLASNPAYSMLALNGFLFAGSKDVFLNGWAPEIRQYKLCHLTATQLFILVLTDACNQCCIYCQASAGKHQHMMSRDTAKKAIDLAFSSPADSITIEFQGGEPTLNPFVLQAAVLYAESCEKISGKNLAMAIVSNLTHVDPTLLAWLIDHNVNISTSLDGPPIVHDSNRMLSDHTGSHETLAEGIRLYQAMCASRGKSTKLQAIQTTTRFSLPYAAEIVNEYQEMGADALYLRPLTPLGYAAKNWAKIGYLADAYLLFYRQAVTKMLMHCRNGRMIREITAGTYLRRILCHQAVYHTEFRSPCGGGVGQMAIHYNGDVYTCDEGRMLASSGDEAFKLGTVWDSYRQLISSPVIHALCTASCIEGLPNCCDCVYQPYCSTCPVVTYGLEGDIFSKQAQTYRCTIAKGILDFLFALLESADERDMAILHDWAQ